MANLTRQESLGLTIPKVVVVVGCGGVGSWTAFLLAMAGVPELWLFDQDTISDHNLNRVPVPESAIGTLKSTAVRELILTVRPECKVMALGEFTPQVASVLGLKGLAQWVVVTTDTVSSRRSTFKWAKTNKIRYIEAGAEGEEGSITGSPAEFSTSDEINPGYASVPAWTGPCIGAAMMAVSHVVHDTVADSSVVRAGWNGQKFGWYLSGDK